MALKDQIGLTGPAYEVDIERGKIREFAKAMHAPLPIFMEGRNPPIPPTFLVSAPYTWGYTIERPRGTVFETIDHELKVSLHAEESFRFFGEHLKAGDRLIAQPRLESAVEKHGRNGGKLTFLTTLNEYRDLDGNLRAEQRSTSVTTENPAGNGNWKPDIPEYQPDYPVLERASPFSKIKHQSFDELSLNDGPGEIIAPALLKQDIVRFQGVVGEDDPLHHDHEWALRQDYPTVFALGTHLASLLAAYASYWLSPEKLRAYSIRFKDMSWPGEKLTYSGTVTELDDVKRNAKISLICKRSDDSIVTEVTAEYEF